MFRKCKILVTLYNPEEESNITITIYKSTFSTKFKRDGWLEKAVEHNKEIIDWCLWGGYNIVSIAYLINPDTFNDLKYIHTTELGEITVNEYGYIEH